jgi:hypothetical protein
VARGALKPKQLPADAPAVAHAVAPQDVVVGIDLHAAPDSHTYRSM